MTPLRSCSASPDPPSALRVVALCGGVGGAKLALGLDSVLAQGQLTIGVNTGDDFEFLGLHISPDLDTVLYTLAGVNDPVRGWGRRDESWHFMTTLAQIGGENWFSLGDRDLALHVERTRRLRKGETLSAVMGDLARRFGLRAILLPMTDQPLRTMVHTVEGVLPFQDYFVRLRCAPRIIGISFSGATEASANPALISALADPEVSAVVICPSNPFLSIDPILAVPGVRAALKRTSAPVVAISPIVGGRAVKGPTVKIMRELGLAVNSKTIAAHYAGLIDGIVIDNSDAAHKDHMDVPVHVARTLMRNIDDKGKLAQTVLSFARALNEGMVLRRASNAQ